MIVTHLFILYFFVSLVFVAEVSERFVYPVDLLAPFVNQVVLCLHILYGAVDQRVDQEVSFPLQILFPAEETLALLLDFVEFVL